MADRSFALLLSLMRKQLNDSDVDEIVRWQMTGWITRKTPVVNATPQPRCHHCGADWHGLPREGCPGSFDTPEQDH